MEERGQLLATDEGTLIRAVLDNVADSLITFDEQGAITACNPAAGRLFGYRPGELIGEPLALLIPGTYPGEPSLGMVRPQVANAPDRRSGGDRNAGFRRDRECRRRDGTLFPAEVQINAMPLSAGLWYVASVHDTSEQHGAEAALAEQTATLREQAQALELAHDAIIACDLLGAIASWNQNAAALYGWSAAEAAEREIHDLLHSRFPDSLEAAINELLRSGRWEGEIRQMRRDGTGVIVASRWALRRDPQGEPSGILMLNSDVTARQRTELKVRATLSELEWQRRETDRARGHLRAVLDAAGEAIAILAPDRRLVAASQAFAALLGSVPADLLGQDLAELAALGRSFADADELRATIVGALDDDERHFTLPVAQRWPEERALELSSAPVWSDEGEHLGRLYHFRAAPPAPAPSA